MILAVIIVYLVAMLLIGFYASKKVETDADYLIGGFKLGIIPMTGTYLATFFSALSLLGGVGLIYRTGIGGSWMPMAWALGSAFGPIIAVRFRRVQIVSPSEFFYHRYGSRGLQAFGAVASIVYLLFNMVVQITAMGVIWNLATGRSFTEGLIIGMVITIVYTLFGGFLAVCWTDTVQCFIFLITIAIGVVLIISKVGSIGEIYSAAALINTAPEVGADPNQAGSMLKLLGTYGALSLFFTFLVQGPGTGTRPEYLQRMQASNSMKTALGMYKYAWVILIFVYIALNIIGVGGRVLIPTMPEGMNSDWIMPVLFQQLTHPIVAGLFFSGLLAAAMSTIDSSMMVMTAAATDLLKIFSKKERDPKKLMWFSRLVTLITGIVVVFMAMNNSDFITDVAGYGFGILGLTYFVPLLFGLYSKRANLAAAWSCVIGGSIAFCIWQYCVSAEIFTGVAATIPAIGIAILVGCVLMWLVSRFTKPMDEKYWKPYLERPQK
jgi:sodium/pantothenate symporter